MSSAWKRLTSALSAGHASGTAAFIFSSQRSRCLMLQLPSTSFKALMQPTASSPTDARLQAQSQSLSDSTRR